MSELKPCPFCGGEAEYGLTFAGEEVYCKKCHAAMPRISTKEQAIEAWNTRAERECRGIPKYSMNDEWYGDECSVCGTVLEDYASYCWNCGARVKGGAE